MAWSQTEIEQLAPILEQVRLDLEPLDGKTILVLCSAAGNVAFWLGQHMKQGRIIGSELSEELLATARKSAKKKELEKLIEFRKAEKAHLPFPDKMFHGLVSEFIVFPTPLPTEIGQREMARVLKPHGTMVLTDVIVTKPPPQEARTALKTIGLQYLCEASPDDFRQWMEDAGLTDIEVLDFTPTVRQVWEQRKQRDPSPAHRKGYELLLEHPELRLGKAIFYLYVRGQKRA